MSAFSDRIEAALAGVPGPEPWQDVADLAVFRDVAEVRAEMRRRAGETTPCAHCGRIAGDPAAGGYATVDGLIVCHPDRDLNRPDCYVKIIRYGHRVRNCDRCQIPRQGEHPHLEDRAGLGSLSPRAARAASG